MTIDAFVADTTNGRRVAIALAASGLDHRLHFVDLDGDYRHGEAYRSLDPTGRIPTFVDGELVLTQTFGILLHLGLTRPGLLPEGMSARAQALDWLAFQMTDLSTMGMAQFHLRNRLDPPQPEAADQLKDKAAGFYDLLERRLEHRDYLTGDGPGLVDIAAWPMLAEFEHDEVARTGSNLARWREVFREWGPTREGLAAIARSRASGTGRSPPER